MEASTREGPDFLVFGLQCTELSEGGPEQKEVVVIKTGTREAEVKEWFYEEYLFSEEHKLPDCSYYPLKKWMIYRK